MKILDLTNLEELKKKLPDNFKEHIRKLEGQNVYIVTSFGESNRPYKVSLEYDGADKCTGKCTCPGWGRLKKKEEPVTPCKHLVAVLFLIISSGEAPNSSQEKTKDKPIAKKKQEETKVQDEIKIRSSGLPLIDTCPAAAACSSDIIAETTGWGAKIGSATHRMIKDIIEADLQFVPKTYPYAAMWGCEEAEDDIRFLGISAFQAWKNEISKWFTNPTLEEEMEYKVTIEGKTLTLTGHPDIWESTGEEAIVVDWKSGRKNREIEYRSQVMGYAFLVAARNKDIKKVNATLVFLRDRNQYTYIFTRPQLRKWMKNLIDKVLHWDGKTYREGEHCNYCPLRLNCEAWNAELRTSVANFANDPSLLDERGQLLPADTIYKAHEQKNLLKKAIKAFENAEKTQLLTQIKKEGDIAIPGTNKRFSYDIRQGRSNIEPLTALPILREYLDGEAIDQSIKIGKQSLSKAIRDSAPKGEKGKTVKEIMEKLETEGALTRGKSSEILTVKEEE